MNPLLFTRVDPWAKYVKNSFFFSKLFDFGFSYPRKFDQFEKLRNLFSDILEYVPGAGGDLVAMKGPQGFSFFS